MCLGIPDTQRHALTGFEGKSQKVGVVWAWESKSRESKSWESKSRLARIRQIKKNLFIRTALYFVSGSPNDHLTKL